MAADAAAYPIEPIDGGLGALDADAAHESIDRAFGRDGGVTGLASDRKCDAELGRPSSLKRAALSSDHRPAVLCRIAVIGTYGLSAA